MKNLIQSTSVCTQMPCCIDGTGRSAVPLNGSVFFSCVNECGNVVGLDKYLRVF